MQSQLVFAGIGPAERAERAERVHLQYELPQWYALYTRSNYETRVSSVLSAQSLEVYVPTRPAWSGRGGSRRLTEAPVFPGYLFVHCPLTKEEWVTIKKTTGVVRIIGYGEKPTPIPDHEIESIRTVLSAQPVVVGHPCLRKGQRVRVVRGPMAGVFGTLLEIARNRHKLVVSVDLLNRAVTTCIDASLVEPCDL